MQFAAVLWLGSSSLNLRKEEEIGRYTIGNFHTGPRIVADLPFSVGPIDCEVASNVISCQNW